MSFVKNARRTKKRTAKKKYTPHNYQKKAIKEVVSSGALGLFLDPGLGKTSIMLAAIVLLLSKKLITKVLIIAPLRVCYSTWPEEISKWEDFKHLRISIIHGSEAKRKAALEADADVYVINPEGIDWLSKQRDWFFDMLVIDESSKFKNTNTKRFKIMRKLINKFPRRYILTGTPAPNGLMNLFGQIFLLDKGASLGRYITHFRSKYFSQTGYKGYEFVLQHGADQQIYDAIRHLVIRMDAADYLELPPLVVNDIIIDLPDNVKKIYDDIENDLVARIDSGEVAAVNAAVASQKCRQIANGGIYLNNEDPEAMLANAVEYFAKLGATGGIKIGSKTFRPPTSKKDRVWEDLHMAKAEAVADLVEELEGQPALIAYEFHHDLERLKKVLGKDTPHIGAGVSPKKSKEIIQAWNRGEIPALLGQPSSMSHGLNMQGAGRAVIYHSMIWDLEAYEQFYKRVWRQGQEHPVFLYHIMAKVRIDFAVRHALKSKHRTQKDLLNAFREVVV